MALEERQGGEPTDLHATAGAHAAGQIAASYTKVSGAILIPTLFVLAIVKFALVVLWFMHLRFDDRRYARFFVMGLAGASILYLIVLISFKVFL